MKVIKTKLPSEVQGMAESADWGKVPGRGDFLGGLSPHTMTVLFVAQPDRKVNKPVTVNPTQLNRGS